MTPSSSSLAARTAWAAGVVLLGLAAARAESVFRCTEDGKTVYQATACKGPGNAVELAPGPNGAEIQDAQNRASADKARAVGLEPPAMPRIEDKAAPRKVDCARLERQRGELIGRRNATVRQSRKASLDASAAVEGYNQDIQRVQGLMAQGGCKAG